MEVILYSSEINGTGKKVKNLLHELVSKRNIDVHPTIESLLQRLKRPRIDVGIVVLSCADTEELSNLLSIRDDLSDLYIVLILPDRENNTVAKGHKLYPRFMGYADSELKDVAAVLAKMIGNARLLESVNKASNQPL